MTNELKSVWLDKLLTMRNAGKAMRTKRLTEIENGYCAVGACDFGGEAHA